MLRAEYPDRETAARRIADGLAAFYQNEPSRGVPRSTARSVEAAVGEVQAIYLRNVFPDMKVGWGTYPNNIGHEDFLGCFRCHDDSHKRADGTDDHAGLHACHTILAMDESNPKVLSDLGLR